MQMRLNFPRGGSQPSRTQSPNNSPAAVTLGKIYLDGQLLGAIGSHNSMPCLSEQGLRIVFSATEEWSSLPSFTDVNGLEGQHGLDCHPLALICETQPDQHPKLPELAQVRALQDHFLVSDLRNVFPFLDPVLFQDTLAQAYNDNAGMRALHHISAKSCVFAFLAFCGAHFSETAAGSQVDCHKYAMYSQTLFSSILEDVSLATLQTMIMLVSKMHATNGLTCANLCSHSHLSNSTTPRQVDFKLVPHVIAWLAVLSLLLGDITSLRLG